MKKKERLDVLLLERGHFESREKAKSAIMAGLVYVGGDNSVKAGMKIDVEADIKVKGELHPYVSRGGLKLEQAIREFGLQLEGQVVLDIGASTGGFTDCALQNGAAQVYAVDVGYGQLAWKLRQDPRVVVMERTNFRHLKPEDLKGPMPSFAVIDVSFISLRLILPVLKPILTSGGQIVALIKPQFEAGRDKVGKNGIVREPETHREVISNIVSFAKGLDFSLEGLTFSPITGGEGNIEFLALFQKGVNKAENELLNSVAFTEDEVIKISSVVGEAHQSLK
jgi:23S rRNA (cytidine1920-2'-O)/16S rRNA (cytidine1409-2'-O)-methyltransferase